MILESRIYNEFMPIIFLKIKDYYMALDYFFIVLYTENFVFIEIDISCINIDTYCTVIMKIATFYQNGEIKLHHKILIYILLKM